MKKQGKPAWAMSKEQKEELDENEDDDLMDFMDNLDIDSYLNDLEFKNMVQTLKKRVSELKEEPDWRDKWKLRLKEKTQKRKEEYLEEKANRSQMDDDMITHTGTTGGLFGNDNMSIASSRTQE